MTAKIDLPRFAKLVPALEQEAKRLQAILDSSENVQIAVFGKYNHGKSTLLNALIGQAAFKTSDKRETVANQAWQDNTGHITWVDTPGLDADVKKADDLAAREGAFVTADIILLVHSLKAGELDKYEADYFQELMAKKQDHQARMLLVLTQMDQVDEQQLKQVVSIIQKQIPTLTTLTVSAIRYAKGLEENQAVFIERSGMGALLEKTQSMSQQIHTLRKNERADLVGKLQKALELKKLSIVMTTKSASEKVASATVAFSSEMNTYLSTVQSKI